MPPRLGVRQGCHVLNASASIRPVNANVTGSRQLSTTTPSATLLFQPRNPRHAFASSALNRRIGIASRAHLSLLPWAKGSGPEFKDAHAAAGEKTTSISESIASFIPAPHDATAASIPAKAPATPLSGNAAATTTSPSSAASPATPTSAGPPTSPSPVDAAPEEIATPLFQQLPDTLSTADLSHMTEHVGFMKEMGLNFGWGPSSMMQYLLESVHVYTGTPWWGTVVITAALVRLFLLYPFFRSTNEMAKMGAMKPIMDKLQKQYQLATASGNALMAQQATKEMLAAKKIAGLKMYWMWTPMVIQGVLGYCSFKLLRAMANLPVPGLQDGGFLWLHDLTVSDPFYILPLAMMALMHGLGRMGGESGSGQMTEIMKPVLLYVMPGIFGLFLMFMPAVLQVSFFTAATLGMAQGYIFRQPGFREKVGLLPIIPPGAPTAPPTPGPAKKMQVLTPQPVYKAPTAQDTLDAGKDAGAFGPVGTAWKDVKTSMDKIWEKANELTDARKAGPNGQLSKRDRRELERALNYEKRRKADKERESEMGRRHR